MQNNRMGAVSPTLNSIEEHDDVDQQVEETEQYSEAEGMPFDELTWFPSDDDDDAVASALEQNDSDKKSETRIECVSVTAAKVEPMSETFLPYPTKRVLARKQLSRWWCGLSVDQQHEIASDRTVEWVENGDFCCNMCAFQFKNKDKAVSIKKCQHLRCRRCGNIRISWNNVCPLCQIQEWSKVYNESSPCFSRKTSTHSRNVKFETITELGVRNTKNGLSLLRYKCNVCYQRFNEPKNSHGPEICKQLEGLEDSGSDIEEEEEADIFYEEGSSFGIGNGDDETDPTIEVHDNEEELCQEEIAAAQPPNVDKTSDNAIKNGLNNREMSKFGKTETNDHRDVENQGENFLTKRSAQLFRSFSSESRNANFDLSPTSIEEFHCENHPQTRVQPYYTCDQCWISFALKKDLKSHFKKYNVFYCPSCDLTFPRRFILNSHIKWVHETIQNSETEESDIDTSDTDEEIVTSDENESSHKGNRENLFESSNSDTVRNASESEEEIFEAEDAVYQVTAQNSIGTSNSQQQKVSQEEPETCNKDVPQRNKTHRKGKSSVVNTNSTPKMKNGKASKPLRYSCVICDKSFSTENNMMMHIHLHTREKPYSCQQCEKTFARKNYLKRHSVTHLKERFKNFKCETCGKSFLHKRYFKFTKNFTGMKDLSNATNARKVSFPTNIY